MSLNTSDSLPPSGTFICLHGILEGFGKGIVQITGLKYFIQDEKKVDIWQALGSGIWIGDPGALETNREKWVTCLTHWVLYNPDTSPAKVCKEFG